MAIVSQDAFTDAGGALLEAHIPVIPGGQPWKALVPSSATHLFFTTDGVRVRGSATGSPGRYIAPGIPGDGQVNIAVVWHTGSTVGTGNFGLLVLAVGDGSNGTCYALNWVGAGLLQVNKVDSTGATVSGALNLVTVPFTPAANTDYNLLFKVRNTGGHPQFILLLNGVEKYNQTDTATLWSSLAGAKRVGLDISGSAAAGDTSGLQAKPTWQVTDYIPIVASPTTLLTNTPGQVVTLTGMDTAFVSATFTLSGPASAGATAITAHSASSDTAATLTLTVGAQPGNLIISDGVNSVTVVVQSTAPAATGLALGGPISGLTGQPSADFVVAGAPPGSAVAANTEVTLGDSGAGGTFSPAVVVIGPVGQSARVTYTPPANPGTPPAPRTARTLTAAAAGLTAASTSYVAITPATTYILSAPPQISAGVPSVPLTVALPGGQGVRAPTAVFFSDGGVGGTFTPEAITLITDAPSGQATYTAPHGITAVSISVTNNGGLADPPAVPVRVVGVSNYRLDAPRVGPAGRTSTPITLTLIDADVTGTVLLTLADGGALGHWSGAALLPGNQVALTQGAPVQVVTYTPAALLVAAGDAPAAVALSVSNDRDLADPGGVTYTVYDPGSYGEVAFLALYSQFAATGQAATLGIMVYGKGNVVVVPHTTQYTEELGTTGNYVFVVPVPLLQSGAGQMDPPSGQTQGYSQAYSAQGVSPILAPADLVAVGSQVTGALQEGGLSGADITSLAEAMATSQGMARFLFYLATNSTQDPAGNVLVRNLADVVIANLSGQQVNTLLQTYTGGVLTVEPGV